jgi:hypothetical protein
MNKSILVGTRVWRKTIGHGNTEPFTAFGIALVADYGSKVGILFYAKDDGGLMR